MKCPVCNSILVRTYDTRLDDAVNVQYRLNICEKFHKFSSVELLGARSMKDGKTVKIELSPGYEPLLWAAGGSEKVGSLPE